MQVTHVTIEIALAERLADYVNRRSYPMVPLTEAAALSNDLQSSVQASIAVQQHKAQQAEEPKNAG